MSRLKTEIRTETLGDIDEIAALQNAAFGTEEGIDALVADLRGMNDHVFGPQSLVAQASNGELVGHVMLSHAWVDGQRHLVDVLVLSPLGVLPSCQGQGVGSALIKAAIAAAEKMGAPLLFLEGNPKYYGQRGFEKAMDLGFRRPSLRIPENAFQVAKLSNYDPDLTGTFVYHDVYWRHGVGLYRD